MATDDDPQQESPEALKTADQYFRELYRISPMAAIFIALPIKETLSSSITVFPTNRTRNVAISGGDVRVTTSKLQHPKLLEKGNRRLPIPHGMIARRFLLLSYSSAYRKKHSIDSDNKPASSINFLGYDNRKSRKVKRFHKQVLLFLMSRISFVQHTDIQRYNDLKHTTNDFISADNNCDQILIRTAENKLRVNNNFMFDYAIPVDFQHVIGTRKKSGFWNVYVFLVDVLPHLPKKETFFKWSYIVIPNKNFLEYFRLIGY